METLISLGLNAGCYLELSKSKGAHLWIFFDAPALAYDARRILMAACQLAKVSKYELFPKQDEVARGGVGNYINLPYDGPMERRRILNWKTHEPVPLSSFLEGIDPFPAALLPLVLDTIPAAPRSTRSTIPNGQYRTATPCYDAMLKHHAGKGERNDMAAALAMHSNRIGLPKEVTLGLLDHWNSENDPPLDGRELARVVESIYSSDRKSLWCEHRVVRPFCQSSCPVYKHAVHGRREDDETAARGDEQAEDGGDLRVERLRIQLSCPPVYYVRVNSQEVTLSSASLVSWQKFRVAVMEQARFLPLLPKGTKWEHIVQDLLATAAEIAVPEEASAAGVVRARVEKFINELARSEDLKDVHDGLLFAENGRVLFRFERLTDFLGRYSAQERLPQHELWALSCQMGGGSERRSINGRDVASGHFPT